MTPTDKIKEHLEKWRKIDEAATKAPWKQGCAISGRYIEKREIIEAMSATGPEHKEEEENSGTLVIADSCLIVFHRNNSAVHRQVIEKLVEAHENFIKNCRNSCLDGDCGAEWEMELKPCPDCAPSRKALAECAEMLGKV